MSTGGFKGRSIKYCVQLVKNGLAKGGRLLLAVKRDAERVDVRVLT